MLLTNITILTDSSLLMHPDDFITSWPMAIHDRAIQMARCIKSSDDLLLCEDSSCSANYWDMSPCYVRMIKIIMTNTTHNIFTINIITTATTNIIITIITTDQCCWDSAVWRRILFDQFLAYWSKASPWPVCVLYWVKYVFSIFSFTLRRPALSRQSQRWTFSPGIQLLNSKIAPQMVIPQYPDVHHL